MSSTQKFCLKWNDYEPHIAQTFNGLREQVDFTDVTLACEDKTTMDAHKVVLSASSNFFKHILKNNKHVHPLIYMKGIKAKDLQSILDFVYFGEVNIYQEDIDSFMAIAEELEVKGLFGVKQNNEPNIINTNIYVDKKTEVNKIYGNMDEDRKPILYNNTQNIPKEQENTTKIDIQLDALSNTDYNNGVVVVGDMQVNVTNDELHDTIESMLEKVDGLWTCKMCGQTSGHKATLKRHVECRHTVGSSHPCRFCDKIFRSTNALDVHNYRNHRNTKWPNPS